MWVRATSRLRCDENVLTGAFAQELPDELFAAPIAVHIGRVEERDPGISGGMQDRHGRSFIHVTPVCAKLPAPEANNRRATTQTSEFPLLHDDPSRFRSN